MKISKKRYTESVRSTLFSMMEFAKTDKSIYLLGDIVRFYENKIKPDDVLTQAEFLSLCKDIGL